MKNRIAEGAICVLILTSGAAWAHADEHAQGDAPAHGSAIGKPGDAGKVSRTVAVEMSDSMRFNPSTLSVKRGETVRFLVTNSGRLKHELVLGSSKELKQHADLMRKFPEMVHVDPNMVAVEPGASGEVLWQFTKTGKVSFACLRPGHFEAGMKGSIAVQ